MGEAIKDRLKLFEQKDPIAMPNQPKIGAKPPVALQKFRQKQNDLGSDVPGQQSQSTSGNKMSQSIAAKFGEVKVGKCGPIIHPKTDHNQNIASLSSTTNTSTNSAANTKPSLMGGVKLSSSANSKVVGNSRSPDSISNGLTQAASPSNQPSVNSISKPQPQVPPKPAGDTKDKPYIKSKPTQFGAASVATTVSSSKPTTEVKSKISGPAKQFSSSPPSSKSPLHADGSGEGGKITDFRSRLRPTKPAVTSAVKDSTSNSSVSSSSLSSTPGDPVSLSPSDTQAGVHSISQNKSVISESESTEPDTPATSVPLDTDILRPKNSEKSSNDSRPESCVSLIIERNSDHKKFKKLKLDSVAPLREAPEKPAVPSNVDLALIKRQYHETLLKLRRESDISNEQVGEEEEEDGGIYDDCVSGSVLPRESMFRRKSERVSFIEEMTPEDEGVEDTSTHEGNESLLEGGPLYFDASSTQKCEEDALDQIYEDEESISQVSKSEAEIEQEKRRLKKEEEAKRKEEEARKKKEEKEKKEEERKRKREEKERQMKEKEEKKRKERFKLTGEEVSIGEGVIKQEVKGKGDDLTVKKGQMVTIIRLNQNPVNKWLVKSDTGLGYVESCNIEVDPVIIRQAMNGQRTLSATSLSKEGDQSSDEPVYDLVPQETTNIEYQDDVYEVCP